MTVRTFADPQQLASAAANDFVVLAREAVRERGRFDVALSGGSTPKKMFEVLAKLDAPWDRIHLWWGDERTVPPDHKDSNYGMAKQALIDRVPVPASNVLRMEGERDPEAAARDYEQKLLAALGTPPAFDLILLGMGPDGHTASLFPGSPGVTETKRYVIANPVDSPLAGGKTMRITLTFPAIAAARHTRFLVAGADKADTLAGVLEGPRGRYPSQLVTGADVQWLVDTAAASKLGGNS